jgi:hypothetical protein
VSLDGYIEDASDRFDWAAPDEDVFRFITDLVRLVDTYLYWRRMYETMAVWDTDAILATRSEPMADFAKVWQAADKVVYSTTLRAESTAKTRFEPDSVRDMKRSANRRPDRRRREPRGARVQARAGRRVSPVHPSHSRRWRQAGAAEGHARRVRAGRRVPVHQRRRAPPLPQPDLSNRHPLRAVTCRAIAT